jgi:hypothetical protein
MPALALQSLRPRRSGRTRCRIRPVLPGSAARSEFSSRTVPPAWVERSHFAVGRFPGRVVFRCSTSAMTVRPPRIPLFEFRLPPECRPAMPSRGDSAPQPLSWSSAPFSTSRSDGPLPPGMPPGLFRLQGLATLLTAYSRQTRAGFVSRRLRSWDFPYGAFSSRKVPATFPPRRDPHTVYFFRSSRRFWRRAGTKDRGFRASTLSGIPCQPTHRSTPTDRLLSWGSPFQGIQRRPRPGFRPISSHAVGRPPTFASDLPRLRVSKSLRLTPSGNDGKPPQRTGQPS